MNQYLLLALAAVPPIILLFIVYAYDPKETPRDRPFLAYFFGACLAVPVVFSQEFLMDNVLLPSVFALAFIIGGLVEEGFKYFVLNFSVETEEKTIDIYDVITSSLAISMGFATSENIIYVFNGGVEVGVLRMLTSIPLHATCGIVMGFFLGNALAYSKSVKYAIIFPVCIHGAYNFFVFWPGSNMFIVGVFVVVVAIQAIEIITKEIDYHEHKIISFENEDGTSVPRTYPQYAEMVKEVFLQLVIYALAFSLFIFLVDKGYLDWLKPIFVALKPIFEAIEGLFSAVIEVFKNLFK